MLWAMGKQQITALDILGLSAAFDTMDHSLLLEILSAKFGIKDKALEWYSSYLSPRTMKVCINDVYSEPKQLKCGVPQGSCSGANVFTAYCSPISEVVHHTLDPSPLEKLD